MKNGILKASLFATVIVFAPTGMALDKNRKPPTSPSTKAKPPSSAGVPSSSWEGTLGFSFTSNSSAEDGQIQADQYILLKCKDTTLALKFQRKTQFIIAGALLKQIGPRKIGPHNDVFLDTPAGGKRFLVGATYRVRGTIKNSSASILGKGARIQQVTVDVIELIKLNADSKLVNVTETPADEVKEKDSVTQKASKKTDGEALDGRVKNYYAVIWARIKESWTIPYSIMPEENLEVVISTRILRDGTVATLAFEKSSGNRDFDESALRSVKKAMPFPPFPDGLRESSIEVGFRFHSSEFR